MEILLECPRKKERSVLRYCLKVKALRLLALTHFKISQTSYYGCFRKRGGLRKKMKLQLPSVFEQNETKIPSNFSYLIPVLVMIVSGGISHETVENCY